MSLGWVISFCDKTGNAVKPWAELGYDCLCIDTEHSIRRDRVVQHGAGRIHYIWGDVRSFRKPSYVDRIIFGMSFTPCTHVAGSGARDFRIKRGYMLRDALEMFEAAGQALSWTGAPFYQENSTGVLSSVPHIGKPAFYFDPCQYTLLCTDDNYTKQTCIWPGNGFIMPAPCPDLTLGPPDDRIHKAPPSDDRADFRSATPMGWSRAVCLSNAPAHIRSVAA
jgi:hypothetical protein